MDSNRVQVNASLRFSPTGELLSRDLLINFRESDLDNTGKLLTEFSRKFGLNLGLSQLPTPVKAVPIAVRREQPRPNGYSQQTPRCSKCNVPMQLRTCRKPGSKYFNTSFYSCPNWRLNGCLEKVAV